MHPLEKAQIAHLKADGGFTKVSSKYTNFVDIFSRKLFAKLPEHTEINNYAINLPNDWQLLYSPIYGLGPIELEILKIYIENN